MSATDYAAWAGVALGGSGIATMIAVLLKARPEARKLEADATKGVADSAAALAQGFAEDMRSLRSEVAGLKSKLDAQELREEQQERRLIIHEQWDRKVAERLRDLGEPIPDPPPLYPDPVR